MFRHFLATVLLVCLAVPAFSADPEKTVTKRLGGLEVIALLDDVGMGEGDTALLIGAGKEDLERAARPGGLKTSINAFVVKTGGKTILFDTGMPVKNGGGILPALKAAGLKPGDIDAIVITHFHFDHVGGLVDNGKAVYPRAELYLPRVELDKWTDYLDFLAVYNVRTNAFEAGREILPGVTSVAAYGHTPGHTIFRLENGGGKLLIIGDLIHIPGVQLANPDVAVTYDVDPVRAVAARKAAFDMAAAEKLPIASMHIPFPGMGVLSKEGKGYGFEPLK